MTSDSLFYAPKSNSTATFKLFCFPFAGGNSSTYIPWIKSIAQNTEIVCAQLPGRSTRIFDEPYITMESLVADLLTEIIPLIDRPYVLFGHSLGAKVAYELMLSLKKIGFPLPVHFIASASPAPFLPRRSAPIHHLPDNEFIAALSSYNGTSPELLKNEELMAMLLPSLRADFTLLENYLGKNEGILNTRLSIFGGEQDNEVNLEDLLGWSSLFKTTVKNKILPGGHFFLNESPTLLTAEINAIIQDELVLLD